MTDESRMMPCKGNFWSGDENTVYGRESDTVDPPT
jgi:hypothetical protein